MNKKLSALLSASASIAVCASLIAGSTFALFTSEAKTNIAITAGKVNVAASLELTGAYSAMWSPEENAYVNNELDVAENAAEFTNKGTAQYDSESNTLTLDQITPGDGIRADIAITNYSTVASKYRIEIGATNDELMPVLTINCTKDKEDLELMGKKILYSDWTELPAGVEEAGTIGLDISLPVTVGNEYQGVSSDFTVSVVAIQQNGNMGEPANYTVSADPAGKSASEVFDGLFAKRKLVDGAYQLNSVVEDGDVIRLGEDIDIEDESHIVSKDVTIDLNGKELRNSKGEYLVVGYTGLSGENLEDVAADVVFENGTIVADAASGVTNSPIGLAGSPTVTFRNIDFVSRNTTSRKDLFHCDVAKENAEVKLVFEDCTFTNIDLNVKGTTNTTLDLELKGCNFECTNPTKTFNAVVLETFSGCTFTIDGCNFAFGNVSGNGAAVFSIGASNRNLEINVSDSTFTYNTPEQENSMYLFAIAGSSSADYERSFHYSNVTVTGSGETCLEFYEGYKTLKVTASGENHYTFNGEDVTDTMMPSVG